MAVEPSDFSEFVETNSETLRNITLLLKDPLPLAVVSEMAANEAIHLDTFDVLCHGPFAEAELIPREDLIRFINRKSLDTRVSSSLPFLRWYSNTERTEKWTTGNYTELHTGTPGRLSFPPQGPR